MLSFVVSGIFSDPPPRKCEANDAALADREIEIIYKLGQDILQYEDLLTRASDVCGELDRSKVRFCSSDCHADKMGSLLALARGAAMYNLARPQMTEENIIHIKGGR